MPSFNADTRECFLDNLSACGNVSEAARLAGISRDQAYRLAQRSDAFRVDWAEAIEAAIGVLKTEAFRRAVDGVTRPLVHRGQLVRDHTGKPIERRQYSDRLLIHLLEDDYLLDRRIQILLGDGARRYRYQKAMGIPGTDAPRALAPPADVEEV